jgi:hypothetical protein
VGSGRLRADSYSVSLGASKGFFCVGVVIGVVECLRKTVDLRFPAICRQFRSAPGRIRTSDSRFRNTPAQFLLNPDLSVFAAYLRGFRRLGSSAFLLSSAQFWSGCSTVAVRFLSVVCWSGICGLGSIGIGAAGSINTLQFEHKSGSPESQLGLLPDFNKPPLQRPSKALTQMRACCRLPAVRPHIARTACRR